MGRITGSSKRRSHTLHPVPKDATERLAVAITGQRRTAHQGRTESRVYGYVDPTFGCPVHGPLLLSKGQSAAWRSAGLALQADNHCSAFYVKTGPRW